MTDQEQVVNLYRRENEAMVNKDIVTFERNLGAFDEPSAYDWLRPA